MRKLNYWHLCLAIWLGIASQSCAQNKATFELKGDEKLIEFTTDRFTLPNLHVTPDGEKIIFDVLGDIYIVPIEGGKAEVLLQDNNWKRAGKLSPDGKTLAYVSDETGEFQIWTIELKTKVKRVYPIKESVHYPLTVYWKDDKHLLIPSKKGLQSFNAITGKTKLVRSALVEEKSTLHAVNRTMSLNKSGEFTFFQKNGDLWAYDIQNNIDLFIEPIPDNSFLEAMRTSANGEKVVFYKKKKEDKSIQDLMSWDLVTNNLNVLNSTQVIGSSTTLNYSFDFIDDRTIVLDKDGEVVRMNIETGEYKPIPIAVDVKKIIKKPLRREPQYIRDSIITASVLRNPVTQKDLDTIYFGAFGKLHSFAKETEVITEIYPKEDRFEVSPSLSPDGNYLAYTTWNDTEMGHLYVRELITGVEYQITKNPGRYINPAWSPDGNEIVYISDETEAKMSITYLLSGTVKSSYILNIHRVRINNCGGKIELQGNEILKKITPSSDLARRFYPIPVYRSNGKSIFISSYNRIKGFSTLREVDLQNKSLLMDEPIPFHSDEALISPDNKYIAFILDNQVWIDTFPHSLKLEFMENSSFINEKYHYKGGYVNNVELPKAKSIYEIAPSYLSWQDEHTLMWGSAEEVYTYDVRTRKTEKIADIKVHRPRAIPKTQYALTNARVITMNKEEEIIEKGTILVKDNRIEAVGNTEELEVPKNYKVFDLEGKTIMPGLIDVHAHYHLGPYEFANQQDVDYIGSLAYGVTTIYDPNSNILDYREQAQLVEIGEIIGPRVFSSGNIVFYNQDNSNYYRLNNLKDVRRFMNSMIKLKVSGLIKDYNIMDSKSKKMLYEVAYNKKLSIATHQDNYIGMMSSILNGYTGVEHDNKPFSLQNDAISFIANSGVYYTPTYVATPGLGNIFNKLTNKEKLKRLNGELLFNKKYDIFFGNELDALQIISNNEIIKKHQESLKKLKKLVERRTLISAGGHGDPLPGIGMHWEMWFMTKVMSNYQALTAATINGAEKLDLQREIGSLKEGKLADMVVLNNNPLEDIFNTADILYTILNGCIYEAETMKQIHPIETKLKPWGWDSSVILENMKSNRIN